MKKTILALSLIVIPLSAIAEPLSPNQASYAAVQPDDFSDIFGADNAAVQTALSDGTVPTTLRPPSLAARIAIKLAFLYPVLKWSMRAKNKVVKLSSRAYHFMRLRMKKLGSFIFAR